MTRDRNEDREHEFAVQPSRRERPWGYDDPYAGRSRSLAGDYGRRDLGRGRFGERADYDHDEPEALEDISKKSSFWDRVFN